MIANFITTTFNCFITAIFTNFTTARFAKLGRIELNSELNYKR